MGYCAHKARRRNTDHIVDAFLFRGTVVSADGPYLPEWPDWLIEAFSEGQFYYEPHYYGTHVRECKGPQWLLAANVGDGWVIVDYGTYLMRDPGGEIFTCPSHIYFEWYERLHP